MLIYVSCVTGGESSQEQTASGNGGGAAEPAGADVPLSNGMHHHTVIPDGQPIPFADTGNPIMAQVSRHQWAFVCPGN